MTCQDSHKFSKTLFDPNFRGCFKHHGRKKTEKPLKCLEYWDSAIGGGPKESTSSEKLKSQAKVLDLFR